MDASKQLEVLRTSSDFTALSRYTKAFDFFKVMGVSSKELVHSNILAALMNEREAHGLGAWFRDADEAGSDVGLILVRRSRTFSPRSLAITPSGLVIGRAQVKLYIVGGARWASGALRAVGRHY